MSYTVKFRLSDADMDDLRYISNGEVSDTMRRLIREEKKRKMRRDSK